MSDDRRERIGLALAGGGLEGFVYELGALRALEETLEGLDLNRLDIYVGVSAGAAVAACLANGISSARLCQVALDEGDEEHPLHPGVFFTPALGEMACRGLRLPGLFVEALAEYVKPGHELGLLASLMRLGRALPIGLFDNEPFRRYLERILTHEGRTDDFRRLKRRLVVVATDLDAGTAVRFGEPGYDDVPISTAVLASTALPGLYPPVTIDGRSYVDGVLLKTLHASVALDEQVGLLLCVNPIVPVDTAGSVEAGVMREGRLVRRGLPTVLAQTFRTLIYSRLLAGMATYEPRFPGQQVVLFEPQRDDYRMFFTNVFRLSSRKAVCQHGYATTRQQLRERRERLEPMLAGFGIRMRHDLLADTERTVFESVGLPPRGGESPVARRLDSALTRLETLLGEDG